MGMVDLLPTITSRRASSLSQTGAREILDSLRLSLPTVAPGQTPGALRFVSLALHIPPQKGGRHRRNVSARNVSESVLHPETHFSTAPLQALHTIMQKSCSTQQAWMYSRNQTTIASCCKHRQPVFLHPTLERMEAGGRASSNQGFGWRVGWETTRSKSETLGHQTEIAYQLADSASSLYTTSFPIH